MVEAERLADRVGLLDDGGLEAVGSPTTLVQDYGGAPRVGLDVADPAEARRALEAAGYAVTDRRGRVGVPDVPAREVGRVARVLDDAGVAFGGLSWTEPDLETVYLELTGRAVEAGGRAVDRAAATDRADGDAHDAGTGTPEQGGGRR
jgi:ABC-2 type transport system ATP-binding protein